MKMAGARPVISGRSSGGSGGTSAAPEVRHQLASPDATASAEPPSRIWRREAKGWAWGWSGMGGSGSGDGVQPS
jgi:hypothetical protein